jgi:hypothetical protein
MQHSELNQDIYERLGKHNPCLKSLNWSQTTVKQIEVLFDGIITKKLLEATMPPCLNRAINASFFIPIREGWILSTP